MSYENPVLIARRGYGDLGADGGTCRVDAKTIRLADGSITADSVNTWPACSTSSGGVVDTVKGLVGSLFGIWGQSKVAQGQAQAYQTMAQQQAAQNATPSWLMPVAIGGAALAAVVLLKKRRNPARRRRGRRNRRR